MATIKAIAGSAVHQIQSGQVIVDLNSVVKELVENSLDAGATSIEVRFKNQGLDSVEVQDNGTGIAADDYATIALKHYTSKLSSYEDLTSLDTFGFRGEALSSLCALSDFRILTARSEDGALGKRLDFEVSGKLKGPSVAAAQKGTTVFVEHLFHNLPVRRKELEKNIKREYGKAVSLLYAYACICVGVRFSVSNLMPKGKKLPVFSTKSNTTTKENITNVFGAKTLLALIKLDLKLDMSPSLAPSTQSARNCSTQATNRSSEVQLQGHISKPTFGEGRQAPDRQMFFVNSRPCLLPQVSKAINEVYKSFNTSQSPFIFANLVMDTTAYDVNVSPDKRTIMLHDQTALLETLKAALTDLFENTDHTVPQSTLPTKKLPAYQPLSVTRKQSTQSQTQASEHSEDAAEDGDDASSEEEESTADSKPAIPVGTPSGLIHKWLARDTETRSDKQSSRMQTVGLSKDKQKLVEKLRDKSQMPANKANLSMSRSQEPQAASIADNIQSNLGAETPPSPASLGGVVDKPRVDAVLNPDPMSTPYGDLFSQPPPALSRQAQHFNAQIERVRKDYENSKTLGKAGSRSGSPLFEPETSNTNDQPDVDPRQDTPHSAIPVITPASQKVGSGPVQNAFDKMRPKRTPHQIAQITVGDVATTTVIGSSPPYKKRRIHKPDDSQAVSKFGASPLLARGLKKNFAAPGSQLEADIDSSAMSQLPTVTRPSEQYSQSDPEDEDEDQEEDNPPATSTRSRNPGAAHVELPTSDALDDLLPAPANDDEWDEEYLDEEEKKTREDERVARLIQKAEEAAARPTEDNLKRASHVLKYGGKRKDATLRLARFVQTSSSELQKQLAQFGQSCQVQTTSPADQQSAVIKDEIDDSEAESRLSLTVIKSDFERMVVLGQFNLGFILALRPAAEPGGEDDIFIIDQHAADEKYNYERLQRTVTLQSQRLVRPLPLELTAVQEELLLTHSDALKANGFEVETTSYITDDDENVSPGRRCRLLTLPMSKEKTFDLSDLEELLHLLSEQPTGSSFIPRPKKVQRMLAMRACRSSIMVGKTLTFKQMEKVVRHMGEMEKPWNCPHGRPTMRHLAGLAEWRGWQEGDSIDEDQLDCCSIHTQQGRTTDWAAWLKRKAN
ncbi:Mismatch repair endonuclease PMS2 [Fulvia fulva]|uniref:DNA mismatch repair protein PMS1 n=1 Tax=Passalora fulva TaxID=5499 RepID=A0A9Q8LBN2_PASFU|nr:Mismatch repair endonuclease PMS2 [Fulvia fulva]KAK4632123.1 Mismatch repair endonuclease PMS2 [Fulvia fulva]KAK4633297.1 Mismatch repair endonuclease PMS2 [Fulvia fulva]UJO14442.1 Mismatch repair endonuclease PMS2 [Fulvia fulva]WPV10895.1 Mismatch repair endonuclease PMS2 [Fulvia fulva]WPV25785.1 Mismatch repair endonuclease PMS2 [Fulvia fulva]